jgi:hypothetical protein
MTDKQSITNEHEFLSADARRRQIRLMQVIFAGAATVATLALFSAARPGAAETASASVGPQFTQTAPGTGGGGGVIAVDDNTNPSSGDIFTQNAQDQSTA